MAEPRRRQLGSTVFDGALGPSEGKYISLVRGLAYGDPLLEYGSRSDRAPWPC